MTAINLKERVAARLQSAREEAGYSKAEVAKLLGTDRQRIHGIENGDRPVDVTTLLQLAQLYGREASSFLTEDVPAPEQVPVHLRAPQGLSAESRQAIQNWGNLCATFVRLRERYGSEEQLGTLKRWLRDGGNSRVRDFAIEGHSQAVRHEMGLDDEPIGLHIFALISEHGIPVFRLALGRGEVDGAFVNYPGLGQVILVNRDQLLTRQIFTAAHELGHVIYEARKQDDSEVNLLGQKNPSEPQIDRFASSLLMPRTAIDLYVAQRLQRSEEGLSAEDVVHLQRHFGVSFLAMLVRLRRLGYISASRFEELKLTPSVRLAATLGYAIQQWEYGVPLEAEEKPEHKVAGLPKQYVGLVMRALEEAWLSQAAAAEALLLSLEEFERYLYYVDQQQLDVQDELKFYDEHVA
ncbi:hypothetical protein GCM10017784_41120 [Deinococcus indicus]|uniref:XRE family transcriptional regulator n=1 Tax=Deinococcus TaxID=1298 RepID=UPI000B091B08|nr:MULTISPECIES: XRE family transcriptional regulator [Deinococcus]PIG98274.1 hypothetical protein AMD26_009040 [Deinococcus sp. UR1]GHG42102.1 hypothetical protein GCM10017784_41120 [Deinococcus indicus]